MNRANDIRYIFDTNDDVVFIFSHNSTISYPLHNHVSTFVIGMVLDGSIELNTTSVSQVYNTNMTFSIPPYLPHSILSQHPYTLLTICIPTDKLNGNNVNIDILKADIAKSIAQLYSPKTMNRRQILTFMDCLALSCDNASHVKPATGLTPIDKLRQQLISSPEEHLHIEEMAHAAYLSKYQFIRNFKHTTGMTPHQFQVQNRIRLAQRLLLKTYTQTEVALTTGFCDQSHFIKQFEKHLGLTPTVYKLSCSSIPLPTNS